MAIDRARTAKGALAGAVAAGVWAAQQPLDKRLLRCGYDDIELLGRLVSRPGWYPVGLAMHLTNGAVFGAVYAGLAPAIPLPGLARGVAAGIVEHLALWPLGRLSDRYHPARRQLPRLTGNRRALAQATWRHLLFGALLGELERRLNPPVEQGSLDFDAVVSSNGHGRIEDAVTVGTSASGE